MSKLSNTVKRFKTMPITGKKKIWFIISGSIIGIGIIFMIIFGSLGMGALNLGIDFTGGTILDIKLGTELTDDNYAEVRDLITSTMDKAGLVYSAPQKTGEDALAAISVRYRNSINGQNATEEQMDQVREYLLSSSSVIDEAGYESLDVQLRAKFPTISADRSLFNFDSVGATASSEIWLNALYCVLIAAALILVYVAFRFGWGSDWFTGLSTGLTAILALLHDIFVMVAFMAIFRIQVNSPFIAAIITIVGYSINNTIVTFDRVRDNLKKKSFSEFTSYELADDAIRQTFTRSINTSVTTLITTVLLFIIGVSAIREFTFPIIVGLVAGTYSSICIAPTLWAMMREHRLLRKKRKDAYTGKKKESGEQVENA